MRCPRPDSSTADLGLAGWRQTKDAGGLLKPSIKGQGSGTPKSRKGRSPMAIRRPNAAPPASTAVVGGRKKLRPPPARRSQRLITWEAFGADGTRDLSAERETPIDRWMGWNAKRPGGPSRRSGAKVRTPDSSAVSSAAATFIADATAARTSSAVDAAVAAALSAVDAIFATTLSPVDATMAPDLVRCGRDRRPWPCPPRQQSVAAAMATATASGHSISTATWRSRDGPHCAPQRLRRVAPCRRRRAGTVAGRWWSGTRRRASRPREGGGPSRPRPPPPCRPSRPACRTPPTPWGCLTV